MMASPSSIFLCPCGNEVEANSRLAQCRSCGTEFQKKSRLSKTLLQGTDLVEVGCKPNVQCDLINDCSKPITVTQQQVNDWFQFGAPTFNCTFTPVTNQPGMTVLSFKVEPEEAQAGQDFRVTMVVKNTATPTANTTEDPVWVSIAFNQQVVLKRKGQLVTATFFGVNKIEKLKRGDSITISDVFVMPNSDVVINLAAGYRLNGLFITEFTGTESVTFQTGGGQPPGGRTQKFLCWSFFVDGQEIFESPAVNQQFIGLAPDQIISAKVKVKLRYDTPWQGTNLRQVWINSFNATAKTDDSAEFDVPKEFFINGENEMRIEYDEPRAYLGIGNIGRVMKSSVCISYLATEAEEADRVARRKVWADDQKEPGDGNGDGNGDKDPKKCIEALEAIGVCINPDHVKFAILGILGLVVLGFAIPLVRQLGPRVPQFREVEIPQFQELI